MLWPSDDFWGAVYMAFIFLLKILTSQKLAFLFQHQFCSFGWFDSNKKQPRHTRIVKLKVKQHPHSIHTVIFCLQHVSITHGSMLSQGAEYTRLLKHRPLTLQVSDQSTYATLSHTGNKINCWLLSSWQREGIYEESNQ